MLKRIKDPDQVSFAVQKQKIKSWDRLLRLSHEEGYRGNVLDDKTTEGLVSCISFWLRCNEVKYTQNGQLFTIDDHINVEVSHTLGLSQQQVRLRETILSQDGQYFLVADFNDFVRIWDKFF